MSLDSAALTTFVQAWRRLQPAPEPALGPRIAAFVERWRALQPPPQSRTDLPDVARLTAVFDQLATELDRARATGALLNAWKVAGLGRNEVRNAAALAWLLDARKEHGLGERGLAGLFDALQRTAPDCPRPSTLARARVSVEHRPATSEGDRVDLVIDHPELLLFVEIKIDAVQGTEQLQRYASALRRTGRPSRLVYLTIHGRSEHAEAIPLRWRELVRALRARAGPSAPDAIRQLIDHFSEL